MKIILSFLLVVFATALKAQDTDNALLYMNKSLSSASISQVEASTSGGGIQVTGVSTADAHIEVWVTRNGRKPSYSKDEIQKIIESKFDFSVTVSGNKLIALARQKDQSGNWNNTISISYKIFVPVASSTELHTSGGGILLANLKGTEHFHTSGGGLDIESLSGKISGTTSGGGISVKNSKDDIELHTSGGGIEAFNCSGTVQLTTSGGSISLKGMNGKIHATTSGGNIEGGEISGELVTHTSGGNIDMSAFNGSLEASTNGGNINVQMLETANYVKLNNNGGNIHLQIPKEKGLDLNVHGDHIKTEGLSNFSGDVEKQRIKGTINGGGSSIEIQAGSGNVELALR